MDIKAFRLAHSSVVCLCLLLTGCNTPGTYFNTINASRNVTVQGQTYTPRIVPINAKLYASTAASSTDSLWYGKHYSYKIGSGDVLTIVVWGHPELSTPMNISQVATSVAGLAQNTTTGSTNTTPGTLVRADGSIYFPYAGQLHAAGLSVERLRKILTKRLGKYVRSPQVSVRVTAFRSQTVHVIGAVRKPSATPLTDTPLSILDAIANTGGIDPTTADTSHIFIVRGSGTHPQLFMLDAKSPSNLLLAERFKLYPRDIIYVPTAGISNWNRFISEILPTLQTAAFTHSVLK